MVFTVGNLLVIGIVLVILAIFRQLDRNSKTLDKVRRYADRAKEELDKVVLERVQNLKDLAIEMDVHQKAGKEILKRIQSIEEGLEDKFAATDTIAARIKEYDRVLTDLVEMTRRAEENIQRIKEESVFVDEVGKKIKVLTGKVETQEARIPELVHRFEEINGAALEAVKGKVLEATANSVQELETRIAEAMQRSNDLVVFLQSAERKIKEETTLMETSFHKSAENLVLETSRKLSEMETMYNERLGEVARKGELMETKALQKLKEHVEEKLKSTYRELALQIEAEKNDLKTKMDELEKIVYQIEQDTTDKLAQLRENNESSLASLQEELGSEIAQKTESLRTDLERQTAETEKAFLSVRENLEKQWAQVEEKTLQRRQNLDTFLQEMEKQMDTLSTELAERMKETESKFHEELASFKAEADRLSQELHTLYEGIGKNLENTKAGLNNEVRTFESFIKKTFQEQEEKVLRLGEDLQGKVLHNLESRLQEQEKDFSYRFARIEEVSSEIDNLENNLRNFMERTRVRLQEDFNNFGKQLHDQRLADQEEVSKGIAELRNTMAELEKGLAELKTQAYENVSEKLKVFEDEFFKDLRNRDQLMQSKFIEWQNKVDSTLDTLTTEQVEERKKIEERYKEELSEVLRDFQGRFFLQIENLNTEMEAFRKQSDYRMQELDKVLQNYREELIRGIEESKNVSMSTFSEEFGRYQKLLKEEIDRFQKEYDVRLKSVLETFETQKRELDSMLENLRSDVTLWQAKVLQELKTGEAEVTNQFAGFKVQVSNTIGTLREEYTGFQEEYQERTKQLEMEAEQRVREFRVNVKETQERFEALHQKLYGKLEESTKLLSLNLGEIEKKQRAFVEQTKIFERADSLKQTLQEQIEGMKADLFKIEADRKELKETEALFLRIKKLGEEATEKLSRFTGEKRRIDSIEEDFKRLMAMSEGIEVKLRQVATSEDGIQSIQANLRSLQTLQHDVEARFERLEKKKKFLDITLEGVDKSFQSLQEIEQKINSLEKEIKDLPEAVEDLGNQLRTLSQGKEEAEEAIAKIARIEGLMQNLEERAASLLKSREWLAKTETRLQELSREAQEQVKLLGSLLKEGAKGTPRGDRGAPTMSARETVTKLAHQGWTVEQIATATKLSRGEVELILELSGKS
ncbi:MAG TPA: hypothetical protein PLG79_07835 [Spirochaetales bacterium]|nr:hypothetical protein [Spirochaetales bacterium]HOV38615.1 hypothetical protein [Spirochaetales bacterium]